MQVEIELPEEIGKRLAERWGDLPGRSREAVLIEGYRSGAISQAQLQALLGLESRWETDALLKEAGIYLDYTEADLARDIENSRKLRGE
jgi:predicted HTH domain antitoxin